MSVLELELQAEVDKYVVLVMLLWEEGAPPMARPVALTDLLFRQIAYRADLSGEEMERYTTANAAAHRYALSLQRRYLRHRALPLFLSDVRRFWRLSLTGKLSHITCAS